MPRRKRDLQTVSAVRSCLYFWARLLGDYNAARRGVHPFAKRQLRKLAWRSFGRAMRRSGL